MIPIINTYIGNGGQQDFTLSYVPLTDAAPMVYLNGLLLTGGVDYTISGLTLHFLVTPLIGEPILVFYFRANPDVSSSGSAVSQDLVDLVSVKNFLRIKTTDNDSTLQGLITQESANFLRLTYRDQLVPLKTVTEVRDGQGGDTMMLRCGPITAINSLSVDGVLVQPTTNPNVPGFMFDEIGKLTLCGSLFSRRRKNVVVNYTYGFTPVAVTSEFQTIPATTPYQLRPSLLPFFADDGVKFFINGSALTPVLTAPAAGQYFVDSTGLYQFAAGDAGKGLLMSYRAMGVPEDVKLCLCEMVAYSFRLGQHADLASQGLGQESTSYRDDYPKPARGIIGRWTRYVWVPA
jgi:hypothetical protein